MLALTGAVVGLFLLARFIPRSRLGRRLVLETTLGSARAEEAPDFHANPSSWQRYLGQQGTARTDLRLSGKAMIGGELVDVVSQFEYIRKGAPIRVVAVEGVRIVVVREETETEGESDG
ncbi:MAG: NfeD family protein [bacterium]